MEELSLFQRLAVWVVPVLFAITVHETAHGWMASRLGDPTARMLGRLTLNPFRHIDPIGTVLVPAITYFTVGFLFGWAKPVPITMQNLHKPKRDMAWVAAAGPLANLFMALLWALVARVGLMMDPNTSPVAMFLIYLGIAGIFVNSILMVLNLFPLPPLDGSRVVSSLLPDRLAWRYNQLEPWGFPILILLMVTGIFGYLLWPLIILTLSILQPVTGLSHGEFLMMLSTLLK